MQEEFGYNQDPDEVTEKQQQACVAASATIGALLRYICRRDKSNEKKREVYEPVSLVLMEEADRKACDARAHDESASPRYLARRYYEANPGCKKLVRDMSPDEYIRSVASIPHIVDVVHIQAPVALSPASFMGPRTKTIP